MKSGKPNLWHFAQDQQTYVRVTTLGGAHYLRVVNYERFDLIAKVLKFIMEEASRNNRKIENKWSDNCCHD